MNTETQITSIADRQSVSFVPFGQAEELTLTLDDIKNVITTPTKSGKQPSGKDCILFMELCRARGLNPYVGDAWLLGYDSTSGASFSLITSIQALQKRAEANEHFDGVESGLIVETQGVVKEIEGCFKPKDAIPLGAWARVHRKDRKLPHTAKINLEVYNTGRSRWSADPCGMIVKCAKAAAYREAFPTELGGLHIGDEMHKQERQATGRVIPEATAPAVPPRKEAKAIEEKVEQMPEPEPTLECHDDLREKLAEDGISEPDFLRWVVETGKDVPKGGFWALEDIPEKKVTAALDKWSNVSAAASQWIADNQEEAK
jgi:phage recombination protein Bet